MDLGNGDVFKDKYTIAVRDENVKAYKLRNMVGKLNQKEEFLKNVGAEFEKLVNTLVNIERVPENIHYSSPLTFEEASSSLISLLDIRKNILDKNQILVGLKIFRRVIERENRNQASPAAEWETDMWIVFEKNIVERQNDLSNLGIVELLCHMLSQNQDIEVQFECILLGIALLLGGNTNVQEQFLKFMQEDVANSFLLGLKELIDSNFETVKKTLSERNKYFWKKTWVILDREKLNFGRAAPLTMKKGMDGRRSSVRRSSVIEQNNVDIMHTDNDEGYLEEVDSSLLLLTRVYRFLQLLCEGHNFSLQSQLRVQKSADGSINRKTYDFVTHTAYYFNALIKQINIESLGVGVQILDFLIESVQGPCEDNQKALSRANIINSSMDFLMIFKKRTDYMKRGFFTEDEIMKMNEATTKSMKLLNSLIEGNTNHEIIEAMNSLDFSFLVEKLSSFYANWVEKKLKLKPETTNPQEVVLRLQRDDFDSKVLESFDVYILIATLAEHNEKARHLLENTDEYSPLEQKALEFFRYNTTHIEILFNERLVKVYFPIFPVCRHLTRDSRKEVMQEVNRSSPNEKITGLMTASPALFDEMEHMTFLRSKRVTLNMKRYNFLRDFSTILSLIINIIIVFTEFYTVQEGQSIIRVEDIGKLDSKNTIKVLGWIQICTSALMIAFWSRIRGPIILRRRWRESTERKTMSPEEDRRLAQILDGKELGELPTSIVFEILLRKGPYDPIFFMKGKRDFGHLFIHAMYYMKNVIYITSDGKFLFMAFYLTVSILGLAVSEITYCLHLLDVINRFDTLKNVVKSVTYNVKQLALTAMLGLILIYVYSLIGFNFFDYHYYNSGLNNGESLCTSMLQCFISTLDLGLRFGGGIGESLVPPSYESDARGIYFSRIVFNLTFFLIINIIFLNIIFGIIVDTFAGKILVIS